ncbi:aldehyde dehydrogenase family protein [Pseudonocardia halophobica]|uniref:aldehyde dehydrogenase family protein n=1 Tax=Pseudonocardia halophobica TaxID=29401 RepID=UPI003D89C027
MSTATEQARTVEEAGGPRLQVHCPADGRLVGSVPAQGPAEVAAAEGAMVVLSDADVERAAGGAVWGAMMNAGQACVSVERVYVEAPVYDEFVAKVVEKVKAIRQGMDAPGSYASEIGAMVTSAQADIVERHVADALAKGARVLVGGKREGAYFEPTVLVDVDHSMVCMREETFGPTLPIMKVADEDEAIRLANDSDYGLSSSLWTRDRRRADRLSRRIEAGSVSVNNTVIATFQTPVPMGGWKRSGLGTRFGGANGGARVLPPEVGRRGADRAQGRAELVPRRARQERAHGEGRAVPRRSRLAPEARPSGVLTSGNVVGCGA